jgi:hypothetical protein
MSYTEKSRQDKEGGRVRREEPGVMRSKQSIQPGQQQE